MIRKSIIAAGIALSIVGCASAAKRVEQGQALQAAGRPAEAAERYIQALQKDKNVPSAREGLRMTGTAAVDAWLHDATAPGANPVAAADDYLAIDDLARRALAVGIFLPVNDDYQPKRRVALDSAIARTISDSRMLSSQGQFADALSRLGRASTAYQPNGTQTSAIGFATADAALAWGRADTAAGRYRTAYERVDQVGALPGATADQTQNARTLQTLALSKGGRRVAIVPPGATINAARELPADALPSLGEAMLADPWVNPPRFVTLASPLEVLGASRLLGLGRRAPTTAEAARLGRTLAADFVVITEIDSVRREDGGIRTTRHAVRTRTGADTAFFTEDGTTRLYVRASYLVVDRDGNRLSDYQTTSIQATAPFSRVHYAGDTRTLDLKQSDRDLLSRGVDDRELVRSFVGNMSPQLAQVVFTEVVRRIP